MVWGLPSWSSRKSSLERLLMRAPCLSRTVTRRLTALTLTVMGAVCREMSGEACRQRKERKLRRATTVHKCETASEWSRILGEWLRMGLGGGAESFIGNRG